MTSNSNVPKSTFEFFFTISWFRKCPWMFSFWHSCDVLAIQNKTFKVDFYSNTCCRYCWVWQSKWVTPPKNRKKISHNLAKQQFIMKLIESISLSLSCKAFVLNVSDADRNLLLLLWEFYVSLFSEFYTSKVEDSKRMRFIKVSKLFALFN